MMCLNKTDTYVHQESCYIVTSTAKHVAAYVYIQPYC
jgi:hypothetical protein